MGPAGPGGGEAPPAPLGSTPRGCRGGGPAAATAFTTSLSGGRVSTALGVRAGPRRLTSRHGGGEAWPGSGVWGGLAVSPWVSCPLRGWQPACPRPVLLGGLAACHAVRRRAVLSSSGKNVFGFWFPCRAQGEPVCAAGRYTHRNLLAAQSKW